MTYKKTISSKSKFIPVNIVTPQKKTPDPCKRSGNIKRSFKKMNMYPSCQKVSFSFFEKYFCNVVQFLKREKPQALKKKMKKKSGPNK